MVVGCEEGAWSGGVGECEVFGDGPCEGEAVEGGGAASDLVEDDEGAVGGVVEDVGGLCHLDHEGGESLVERVVGADSGEDAVGDTE